MAQKVSLKIAAYFDTRPGHAKQTLGLLGALEELTPVETIRIDLPHQSLFKELISWLRFYLLPKSKHIQGSSKVDLIIGTGSRTHIPMLTHGRALGIPTVTCMTPTLALRNHFSLCCVPRHDQTAAAPHIFPTNGPPNPCRSRNKHDPHRGLILIGGKDQKSHHWDTQSLLVDIGVLIDEDNSLEWTISSSPRTPEETNNGLQQLASHRANVTFIRFEETKPGWIEKEYDRNAMVWVSADSMSMVFESLSAGCKVGLLPIKWKRTDCKFQRCEKYLRTHGYVISLTDWRGGKTKWPSFEPLNEAMRCAEEILKRWWPERLQ
ncbi:MAG: mitochondrial fission ELM1 family protein [Desulfobulbaceae bacterium]|nr:mitochondrial fission ELM1 family protein [Desulfobulbaceae bacterium]